MHQLSIFELLKLHESIASLCYPTIKAKLNNRYIAMGPKPNLIQINYNWSAENLQILIR